MYGGMTTSTVASANRPSARYRTAAAYTPASGVERRPPISSVSRYVVSVPKTPASARGEANRQNSPASGPRDVAGVVTPDSRPRRSARRSRTASTASAPTSSRASGTAHAAASASPPSPAITTAIASASRASGFPTMSRATNEPIAPRPRTADTPAASAADRGRNGASRRRYGTRSRGSVWLESHPEICGANTNRTTPSADPIASTGPIPTARTGRRSAIRRSARNVAIERRSPVSAPISAAVARMTNRAVASKNAPARWTPSPRATTTTRANPPIPVAAVPTSERTRSRDIRLRSDIEATV